MVCEFKENNGRAEVRKWNMFFIAVCNKDGDATFLGRNQKFENPLLCAL